MSIRTTTYRTQHEELERIAGELAGKLVAGSADELRKDLIRLAGVLKVHLAMEDRSMYPRLLEHEDAAVRSMAREYQLTMGDLAPAFDAFYQKWMRRNAIEDARADFASETAKIAGALGNRIKLENENLYDMIDRKDIAVI